MRFNRVLLFFWVIFCLVPTNSTFSRDRSLSIVHENDLFFGGSDGHYTSGEAIILTERKAAPKWSQFYLQDSEYRYFSLNHTMYTPRIIGSTKQYPDDRPWAAHMYGNLGSIKSYETHTEYRELSIGIIGPLAQGEPAQLFFHELTGTLPPEGWHFQLTNELVASAAWEKEHHIKLDDYIWLHPRYGATVGLPFTHASAGVSLEVISLKELVQGNAFRMQPGAYGRGVFEAPRHTFFWSFFAAVDARLVAHNTFLDGNTFQDSPRVEKNITVADLSYGLTLGQNDIRFSVILVHRSKEFVTQDKANTFSALSLDVLF